MSIKTWADGFGRWYAAVPVEHNDGTGSRLAARSAIRDALFAREGRRGETVAEFVTRIPVPRVEIAPQYYQHPGYNVWVEIEEDSE